MTFIDDSHLHNATVKSKWYTNVQVELWQPTVQKPCYKFTYTLTVRMTKKLYERVAFPGKNTATPFELR